MRSALLFIVLYAIKYDIWHNFHSYLSSSQFSFMKEMNIYSILALVIAFTVIFILYAVTNTTITTFTNFYCFVISFTWENLPSIFFRFAPIFFELPMCGPCFRYLCARAKASIFFSIFSSCICILLFNQIREFYTI